MSKHGFGHTYNHHLQALYPSSSSSSSHSGVEEQQLRPPRRCCGGCKALKKEHKRLKQSLEELRAQVHRQTEITQGLVAHLAERAENHSSPVAPDEEEGQPLPLYINESTLDTCIDQALRHLFSTFQVRCTINQFAALPPGREAQQSLPPSADPLFYVVFLTSDRFEEQVNQAKFEQLRQAHPKAVILAMRKGNNPQCFKQATTTLYSPEDTRLLTFYFGLENRIEDCDFNRRSAEALRGLLPAWALPPKKRLEIHLPPWLSSFIPGVKHN